MKKLVLLAAIVVTLLGATFATNTHAHAATLSPHITSPSIFLIPQARLINNGSAAGELSMTVTYSCLAATPATGISITVSSAPGADGTTTTGAGSMTFAPTCDGTAHSASIFVTSAISTIGFDLGSGTGTATLATPTPITTPATTFTVVA
jgi:hypothetical protein